MSKCPRFCSGHPGWLARAAGNVACLRQRYLQLNQWAPLGDTHDMAARQPVRLMGQYALRDCDAVGAQPIQSTSGNPGIRIANGTNHTADASGDDGVAAWRRLAVMRARLQCYVKRGALGTVSSTPYRLGLCMWTPAGLCPASRNHLVGHRVEDRRADRRIRRSLTEASARHRQRHRHHLPVRTRGRNSRHRKAHISRWIRNSAASSGQGWSRIDAIGEPDAVPSLPFTVMPASRIAVHP